MAVAGGRWCAGSGSTAGGGAELRGSGGAQRTLRRHDERVSITFAASTAP